MHLDPKELKRLARQDIRRAVPAFWLVALVYLLLTNWVPYLVQTLMGVSASLDSASGATGVFLYFLFTLLNLVLAFGYDVWALRTVRDQEAGISTLFDGFSIPVPVVAMKLLVLLLTMLWSLLLAVGVALALFLLLPLLVALLPANSSVWPFLALLLPLYLLLFLGIYLISLRYAMAPYLLQDYTQAGPLAAVRSSVALMRGCKWKLFRLQLSFLGWHLLNFLIGGVVFYLTVWPSLTQALAALPYSAAGSAMDSLLYLQVFTSALQSAVFSVLAMLPLELWLLPYTTAANARFYLARIADPFRPL